jgi:hypothetical protein
VRHLLGTQTAVRRCMDSKFVGEVRVRASLRNNIWNVWLHLLCELWEWDTAPENAGTPTITHWGL